MYYNLLRVINDEFSQQVNMSRHIFPLKNNSENYRKYIFPYYSLSLIISIIFPF
jgi:hypothetical protein